MRDVQLAFFKAGVPNQDIPQDHAIASAFYGYAHKHKIKWSLSGSNLATEGILPESWGYDNLDLKHIKAIHRQFGTISMRKYPAMSGLKYGVQFQLLGGMKIARPLNLIPYSKELAMETLAREFDWKYYGGKHYESRFTKFFQAWWLPTRWGYDKRLAHLSSLIASGLMSRESALEEFRNNDLPWEDIEADKDYMSRKLSLSREEFEKLMSVPIRPHSDYPMTSGSLKRMFGIGAAIRDRLMRK